MKALSFKSVIFVLAMILNSAFASAQNDSNFIYDTKYENDVMVSKTVFERDNDTNGLTPKTMYEYKYDTSGRISEKIAYKWDEEKGSWINNFRITCNYNTISNTAEIVYSKWDNKTHQYDLNSQRQTYSIEDAQKHLAKK